MNRATVIAIIRDHEPELKALGVVSVSLFGSTARDEARNDSDVDLAVRLEDLRSGFATFGRLDLMRERLCSMLGSEVDVVPEPELPEPTIDRDRCRAF